MNIDIKYDIETEKKLRFLYGCVYHEDYSPKLGPIATSLIGEVETAGRIWSATFTPRSASEEKYLREVIAGMKAQRSADVQSDQVQVNCVVHCPPGGKLPKPPLGPVPTWARST